MKADRCIRFDWAMKRMLCDTANLGVLEGLSCGKHKGGECYCL